MAEELIVVVKRDCPTCELIAPVIKQIANAKDITIYSQDDPTFPTTVSSVVDDRALEVSHQLGIEIVPTLIRIAEGQEVERQIGWHKGDWESLTGVSGLDEGLPDWGAGCGAKNVEPANLEQLKIRFGETGIQSRLVEIGAAEDEMEAMFERGWKDGLPLVPTPHKNECLGCWMARREPRHRPRLMPTKSCSTHRREGCSQRSHGRL